MTDGLRIRTAEAFDNPQTGDRFHEMYSYWVYVIGIDGEKITTFESGYHPSQHPARGKCHTYPSHEDYRAYFAYGTIPGYWVMLNRRDCNVDGWLERAGRAVRIDQEGPASWRWWCECHERESAPWPVRPTELNAQAEHDLLFRLAVIS